ncbi:MAG: hypothetical protein E7211_08830 [Clostridium lundense]|nr:hypothetical protein [Clostridium lundense]
MDKLFFLLAVVCIICLVVGLIKPSKAIPWVSEERKTRKNIVRYYGIGFVFSFILFIINIDGSPTGNTVISNSQTTEPKVHSIILNSAGKENLKNNVAIVKSDVVNSSEYSISIVGMTFDKSSGDSVKDASTIGTGLINDTEDNVARGIDIGFKNSSDKEIAKKDAYLCLYLKYTFKDSKTSQRNSVIPDIKISAKDDQGDEFSLIHYSMDKKYIKVDYPYGLVMFKGYSDSKIAYININQTEFKLDLTH